MVLGAEEALADCGAVEDGGADRAGGLGQVVDPGQHLAGAAAGMVDQYERRDYGRALPGGERDGTALLALHHANCVLPARGKLSARRSLLPDSVADLGGLSLQQRRVEHSREEHRVCAE